MTKDELFEALKDLPHPKKMWGEGTPWKNESQWMTYIRGCLRKAWNTHPSKLEIIKKYRKQIKNPNPKGNKPTVWGFTCPMCGKDYVTKEGQVDHIEQAGQLNTYGDILPFFTKLIYVLPTHEDLRLICKKCHGVVSYAEKHGISLEEAKKKKAVIEFSKIKTLSGMVEVILEIDPSQGDLKTKKQCVQVYKKLLEVN